jgi:hypothetical protein
MKRYQRKVGDVFRYSFNGSCRYLQYIGNDDLQLKGDVIRVFKGIFSLKDNFDIETILSLPVDFYCISYVINCVKFGNWEKIGNSSVIGDISDIRFRCAADYGDIMNGEPIKFSNHWYVWKLGDSETTNLGSLIGYWKNAHIGGLLPPDYINERLREGKYKFIYPEPL